MQIPSLLPLRYLNPPGTQQVSDPSGNLADVPLLQYRALTTRLLHVVMEGEKTLQTATGSDLGEGDMQR